MRISYWSSDVCSSDLRAPIELLDRAIRLTPAARIPPTGVLGRGSERATVGVGRRQDLVGRILIGLCLPVRLARHLTPFGDRTRGHRWREAEPRDRRGCIVRSEEQTSELQSLLRTSYAVFCLQKKKK